MFLSFQLHFLSVSRHAKAKLKYAYHFLSCSSRFLCHFLFISVDLSFISFNARFMSFDLHWISFHVLFMFFSCSFIIVSFCFNFLGSFYHHLYVFSFVFDFYWCCVYFYCTFVEILEWDSFKLLGSYVQWQIILAPNYIMKIRSRPPWTKKIIDIMFNDA